MVVTYNRLSKLQIALKAFNDQTFAPSYVLVVNNGSTDGTKEFLENWVKENGNFKKYIINNRINKGGSGGFYDGLEFSCKKDSDWIWVSDDDAFPEEDALEKLKEFIESKIDETNKISAVCCQVINFGDTDYFHRRSMILKLVRVLIYYREKKITVRIF